MFKKISGVSILIIGLFLLAYCATTATRINHFDALMKDIRTENYANAVVRLDQARESATYMKKDRVLFYLDKGIVLHYQGDYQKSTENFEAADRAMEELFTKSISSAAVSFLLNDNALDYYGEVYENFYINIFKALNYLHLKEYDDAYVEVRRVNDKLRELEDKYEDMVRSYNTSKDAAAKIEKTSIDFYNDALAHYLSYLIFRAENEEDDSRISLEKLHQSWETQPDVYKYPMPAHLKTMADPNQTYLNVIAFTGQAPFKKAVGGMITTYDGYLGISDLSMPIALPTFPFPGIKEGYHFKFSFPIVERTETAIQSIDVFINNNRIGSLELLEDIGQIAIHTFAAKRNMVYAKTLIRTVAKGLAAAEAKKKIKKEAKTNDLFGALVDAAVDIGVDATENADLRCWRTIPQNCFIGEFPLPLGKHTVEIRFMNQQGLLVQKKTFPDYEIRKELNLIDLVSLN
jgi:hypothetical protein